MPAETLRQLQSVKAALAAPGKTCEVTSPSTLESRKKAERDASERIRFLDTEFRVGKQAAMHYEMDPGDLAEVRQAIRQGKQHSDLLVATIHSHDTGLGCEEPGDFLPVLAHSAIDAGAGIFIAHGEHRLMPIEIYKGRPIFYSLANFFWSDILEPIPEETYEQNRDLLAKSFGEAGRPTDADLLTVWNAGSFDDPRVFETVIAVSAGRAGASPRSASTPSTSATAGAHDERHAPPRFGRDGPRHPRAPPAHLEALRHDDRDRGRHRRHPASLELVRVSRRAEVSAPSNETRNPSEGPRI